MITVNSSSGGRILTNKQKAFMIEQFVAGTSIRELAAINSMSFDDAQAIIKLWYPKGQHSIIIPSVAVNSDRREFIKAYSDKLNQHEMADALGVHVLTVGRWSTGLQLNRKKAVYNNPLPFHYLKVSIILNQETGIYYFSATEAADTIGKSDDWLNNRIKKMSARNNTSFIYCGPYKEPRGKKN